MNLLLDTHVLVGCVDAPEKLPGAVAKRLADASEYPVGISAISAWEIASLAASGRIHLSQSPGEWLRVALRPPFVRLLALTPEIACEAAALPGDFAGDPADKIILATARIHGLTLVTGNPQLLSYPQIRTLWE